MQTPGEWPTSTRKPNDKPLFNEELELEGDIMVFEKPPSSG